MGKTANLDKDNYIYAYYQGIKDGTICVSSKVRAVYEYIIKGLQEKQFFFNAKAANHAVEWIEYHCFHVEGPLAPSPFKLELYEKAFVSILYGIKDAEGHRQFREVLLVEGRKCGKSLLGASVAAYEFRATDEYGVRVYCLAPKLEQADIVYNNIWQMITLDPDWQAEEEIFKERDQHNKKVHDDALHAKRRQSDLAITGKNSTVKKIAFSSKKSDGFNPSLVVLDELGAWSGDAGLKQYEVMGSAMGARPDGLMLGITTAGYVDGGIYDELIMRATRFIKGDSREKRFLPLLYMIDNEDKWSDLNELRKSMPKLGVSVSVDYMLEEIAKAEQSLSKLSEFKTKYCCIQQNSSLAWLDAQDVRKMSGEPLNWEDFRGCYCVLGIDLSQTVDLTAGVCLIEKNGELYVFAKFWIPGEKIDDATMRDNVPYNIYIQRGLCAPSGDNFIDYHDCFNWCRELVEERGLLPLMVGYDRYSAQYLIQDLKAYGFRTDDVYQGENLYPVMQETEGYIKDGKIHIGDNDLLKMHLLNSALKMSTERGRGKLVKINANLHIDGTAALLDAMTVRQKWYGEMGAQLSND